MSSLPFRRIEKIFGRSRQYSPQVLALRRTELRSSTQSQVLLKLIHGLASNHYAAHPSQRPNIGKTKVGNTLALEFFLEVRQCTRARKSRKAFNHRPPARRMRQHALQQQTPRMHYNVLTNR